MNGPVAIERRPGAGEAIEYTGGNDELIARWLGPKRVIDGHPAGATLDGGLLIIHTSQGDMTPNPTDWVIWFNGETYPIRLKAFVAGWQVRP